MTAARPDIQWIGSPNFRAQSGISKVGYCVHWMVGNLAGTDRSFVQSSYGVATNYGIEEGAIHQYVADKDYAFGTGDTWANSRLISVEHAGGWLMPDGSRYSPNDDTLLSSARLLAYLADLYGWGPLALGVNVFEHRNFVSTECPGSTRTQQIIDWATIIRNGGTPGGGPAKKKEQGHMAKNVFYCTDIRGFSPLAVKNARGMFIVAGAPSSAKDSALMVTENEDLVNVFLRSRGMDAHDLPAIGFGDLTQMLRWEIGFDTLTDGTKPGGREGSAMVDGFTWNPAPGAAGGTGSVITPAQLTELVNRIDAADDDETAAILAAIAGIKAGDNSAVLAAVNALPGKVRLELKEAL